MHIGNCISKNLSVFILYKILQDNFGISYVCATIDRLNEVSQVLSAVIQNILEDRETTDTVESQIRLLKHVLRCFLQLTYDQKYGKNKIQTNLT